MDARQEAKLSMYNAVLTHIEANTTITATVPAFATVATSLRTVYNNIITAAQQEAEAIAGVTMDKAETRNLLCTEAANIAAAVYAYATSQGDNELKEQVNLSFTKLQKTKDELLVPTCNIIHQKATLSLASLTAYGITSTKLSDFQDLIDEYAAQIPGPRNAVSVRAAARTAISNHFKQADQILKQQMDKLALQFQAANPEFYNAFKNNRIIIDAGTSNTMAKGIITDAATNQPIPSVTVQTEGAAYSTTSNAVGEYELKVPVPGTYNILFTKTDYQPKTETAVTLTLGQTTLRNTQLTAMPS